MRRLAGGDLSVAPIVSARADEMGDMGRAVEVFRVNAISRAALERQQESERAKSQSRHEQVERLVNKFRQDAEKALALLSSNAKDLADTAAHLNEIASGTTEKARWRRVFGGSSGNVLHAAATARWLSIAEIGDNRTSRNINDITGAVATNEGRGAGPGGPARRRGGAPHSEILPDQQRLNASIEAARAACGRGFSCGVGVKNSRSRPRKPPWPYPGRSRGSGPAGETAASIGISP
jgi:methyl-accepting chemotaxis protein